MTKIAAEEKKLGSISLYGMMTNQIKLSKNRYLHILDYMSIIIYIILWPNGTVKNFMYQAFYGLPGITFIIYSVYIITHF